MSKSSFIVKELELPGVLYIQPKIWEDDRGFFVETFHEEAISAAGINCSFVQDNLSFSKKGVLRGLHFQRSPHAQGKLVRCAQGEIFDVAADHEPKSPTYGKSIGATLSGETQAMLYIPASYLHGFCVISDKAVVEYKVSDYYHPESVAGVRYNDPTFNIAWPILNPILSKQDSSWPFLDRLT